MSLISGLHHITTIAGSAQANIDFNAGILGLRMVKQTVNFDAPDVYHLYYGNEYGTPGTILTSFPFGSISSGRHGKGQAEATQFSVDSTAFDFWRNRLDTKNIKTTESIRFGQEVLTFYDHDGLALEIVGTDNDSRSGYARKDIPQEFALKGFYGITLLTDSHAQTAQLLETIMNHEFVAHEGNRYRYKVPNANNEYVDIIEDATLRRSLGGNGTVHHVAFQTNTAESQTVIREQLLDSGYHPTPIIDRQYFHSIYFREPNGILFEIATLPPGFTVDESLHELGTSLMLPPQHEHVRNVLEQSLEQLNIRE